MDYVLYEVIDHKLWHYGIIHVYVTIFFRQSLRKTVLKIAVPLNRSKSGGDIAVQMTDLHLKLVF